MRPDLILQIMSKLLMPFILVFAFYVQFHGDYGPGGGFQAGVIASAAIILYAITFGLAPAQRAMPPKLAELMMPLGVLIFTGVGVVSFFRGGNFLNYSVLGHNQVHAQEWGILLVELGVFVTVAGTMTTIFYAFAGRGR